MPEGERSYIKQGKRQRVCFAHERWKSCVKLQNTYKILLENVDFLPRELNACLLSKTHLQSQNSTGAHSTIVQTCQELVLYVSIKKRKSRPQR